MEEEGISLCVKTNVCVLSALWKWAAQEARASVWFRGLVWAGRRTGPVQAEDSQMAAGHVSVFLLASEQLQNFALGDIVFAHVLL